MSKNTSFFLYLRLSFRHPTAPVTCVYSSSTSSHIGCRLIRNRRVPCDPSPGMALLLAQRYQAPTQNTWQGLCELKHSSVSNVRQRAAYKTQITDRQVHLQTDSPLHRVQTHIHCVKCRRRRLLCMAKGISSNSSVDLEELAVLYDGQHSYGLSHCRPGPRGCDDARCGSVFHSNNR